MTKHTEKPETRTSGFNPFKSGTGRPDSHKPAEVEGSSPLPEAKAEPVKAPAPAPATPAQPAAWATGHGDERSRRLTLTVDGQNYNGTVLEPHDRAAVAKMLAELADKVRVGVA